MVRNGTTINYKYDGLRRRVEKEVSDGVSTKVTRFIYDEEDILLELDGNNNVVARYTHGPDIDEPLVMEKGSTSFFYHSDGLGSITEITDSSAAVAQRYTYSSFGKIESQLDPSFLQPYTFTSREFDPEAGLYFYRTRYYDAMTGRFLQQDPMEFSLSDELLNLYSYVLNNPINLIDPEGLHGRKKQSTGSWKGHKDKHERGEAREKRGREPKHGRVPRKRPEGWKGKWPPAGKYARMGGIICLLPWLLEDLDVYLRAQESGKSFSEQVQEDLEDAGPIIDTPLGPIPNPYHKPTT